jgi:hypothetical protein
LGWEIDTGELTIRLPWDKYVAWVEDIANALRKGNVSKHELESIVGRLNHASFIILLARHFLRHLRQQIPHGRNRVLEYISTGNQWMSWNSGSNYYYRQGMEYH